MPSLHPQSIVKRPIISEKSNFESSERGRYSFEVELHATKEQIKTAVSELYKVRVAKVRVQVRRGKAYRTKAGEKHHADWKRAVVELHPEDKIELF